MISRIRGSLLPGLVMPGLIAVSMFWLDRPVALWFKALDHDAPMLIAPFKAITDIGKSQWYLYPSAALCLLGLAGMRLQPARREFWHRQAKIWGFIFAAVALTGLIVDGLKILVGRPRPVLLPEGIFNQFTPFIINARWWSFPSGHTATSMALALAAGGIFPLLRWPLLLFAGVAAASRIIVAAHYPADVIGGIFVACLVYYRMTVWDKTHNWGLIMQNRDFSSCQPVGNPVNPAHDPAKHLDSRSAAAMAANPAPANGRTESESSSVIIDGGA